MLVETQYLSNSKKLVVSYVDKTGDIKLKYFNWDNPMKYVSCEDLTHRNIQSLSRGMVNR